MSIHAMAPWRAFLAAFSLLTLTSAFAQTPSEPLLKLTNITSNLIDAPNFGNTASGSQGNSNDNLPSSNPSTNGPTTKWLKVEFQYEVNPLYGNYLDEAEFRVWIEGRDTLDPQAQSREGVAIGLNGTVTYVNIPKSKAGYGVVYVHPNTINRYSGAGLKGADDYLKAFDVHVEAAVSGQTVSQLDRNKNETDPFWFRQLKAINGQVYTKDVSPFILSDKDRYPGIKLRNGSQ